MEKQHLKKFETQSDYDAQKERVVFQMDGLWKMLKK